MVLVKDVLSTTNVSVGKNSLIKEAVNMLDKSTEEAVVIIDDLTNKPLSIFTERDLIQVYANQINLNQKIDTINNKPLITVNQNRSIEYALSILIDNNIRRVIAVDDEDKFIGIVSQKHIIKYLEEESFKTHLLVSNIISQKQSLISISSEEKISKAISIMAENKISSVVVVDNKNIAIGLFTEKDVVGLANKQISLDSYIKDSCILHIEKVKDKDSLKDVVDMMSQKDISIVLVVDFEDNPVTILTTRDIAYNIKGNYNRFLENRLKGVKNTLNYIGEFIIEVCTDNSVQIVQWINEASIQRFTNLIIDKPIASLVGEKTWTNIYETTKKTQNSTKKNIQIGNYFYEMICSYYVIGDKETILLILRDITDYENRVNKEIHKREEKEKELKLVQNVINQQSSLIIVSNADRIEFVNQSFLDFYDVKSPEEFHEKYRCVCDTFISHPSFFHLEDKNERWISKIIELPEKDRVVSILNVKTIEPKAFSVQINHLLPNSTRYVITLTDITDIKLESQRHYYHATHDTLTKIYNRSFFLDKLDDELTYSSRYQVPFSIVIFDIDHFKRFNDTFGHLKGDEVLVAVCDIVKLNIRKTDIFARWGGEEFVILLPNTPIDKAEVLAQNLRKLIETLSLVDVESVTASFGISEYKAGDVEKTIFHRADEALYKAKENGRNQVVTVK